MLLQGAIIIVILVIIFVSIRLVGDTERFRCCKSKCKSKCKSRRAQQGDKTTPGGTVDNLRPIQDQLNAAVAAAQHAADSAEASEKEAMQELANTITAKNNNDVVAATSAAQRCQQHAQTAQNNAKAARNNAVAATEAATSLNTDAARALQEVATGHVTRAERAASTAQATATEANNTLGLIVSKKYGCDASGQCVEKPDGHFLSASCDNACYMGANSKYHPDVFIDLPANGSVFGVKLLIYLFRACGYQLNMTIDQVKDQFFNTNDRNSVRNVFAAVSYGYWDVSPENCVVIEDILQASDNYCEKQDPGFLSKGMYALSLYYPKKKMIIYPPGFYSGAMDRTIMITGSLKYYSGMQRGRDIVVATPFATSTILHEYIHTYWTGHSFEKGFVGLDASSCMAPSSGGRTFLPGVMSWGLGLSEAIAIIDKATNLKPVLEHISIPAMAKKRKNCIIIKATSENDKWPHISITFRTQIGYDKSLPNKYNNKLLIHRKRKDPYGKTDTELLDFVGEGQTSNEIPNIRVIFERIDSQSQSAIVSIEYLY